MWVIFDLYIFALCTVNHNVLPGISLKLDFVLVQSARNALITKPRELLPVRGVIDHDLFPVWQDLQRAQALQTPKGYNLDPERLAYDPNGSDGSSSTGLLFLSHSLQPYETSRPRLTIRHSSGHFEWLSGYDLEVLGYVTAVFGKRSWADGHIEDMRACTIDVGRQCERMNGRSHERRIVPGDPFFKPCVELLERYPW